MTHDYHEGQPGYSAAQILKDGCAECTVRSEHPWLAIGHLDPVSFLAAWERAITYALGGLPDPSDAELPVLMVLRAIAVQLERAGLPFGAFPGNLGWAAITAAGEVSA